MAPMFSKFVDGEVSSNTNQPASGKQHQDPCKEHDPKSKAHTQLTSSDEPPMSQAETDELKEHEEELEGKQCLKEVQLAGKRQHTTHEARVPVLLNPQPIKSETELPEAIISAINDMAWPKMEDWTDKRAGLTLGNGQLTLKVSDWRTPSPTFSVENNPSGNPKCDLDAVLTASEIICVDFKMPTDYPDGMLGMMRSIEALFTSPEAIGMSNMETGSAPAYRESKNPERDNYHIKWTSPWETTGCRVSWMKAKEKSPIMKFKFVSARNARRGEQMMVTVDEQDEFYQNISNKDPNTYGKWMALPVRIWLRIQWLVSKTGDVDNKLFGKLLINDNSSSSKKKKNKGKKAKKSSKCSSKRARASSRSEESSEDEASDEEVVPSPEPSVLGQEHEMETMGSQELTKEESAKEELTTQELTEKDSTKRVPTLTIDTQKSNRRSKGKGRGKRTPGSSGSDRGKKEADKSTNQRGDDQGGDLLPGVQDIARQDVPAEQQLAAVAGQQPVSASRFPITPSDVATPLSSSFETARTHLSPHTPLPSSSLSAFFTPTSISCTKDEDDGEREVKAEENEPAEISDQLRFTPQGDEDGLRCPVSNNRDEVWFSDPEEYLGGHEVQEAVLRRRGSFDVASLGLFKGREIATSSPTADPPSSSCVSSELSTADSAESGTDGPSSDGTVHPDDQTLAESVRHPKKKAYKRRKQERRKRKKLLRRQEFRNPNPEHSVSDASSQVDGVEGRSPSPPESFADDEPTPTAKQFGDSGTPSPESQMDLGRVAMLCEKPDCQVLCDFSGGVSVVCPKCGPFSEVRYCGNSHLWEDVKRHWLVCSTGPVHQQSLAGSIPYNVLEGPPILPSLHQWDTPERHRQAVWFSSARDRGDYFVFADWDDLMEAADAPASHVGLRCSPRIAHIVRFEDAEEKDRFRRCLAICLFAAVEHPALVDYTYRLVRDWMRAHNMWASDKDMDSMLRYQMGREMGGAIAQGRLGLRHACETEWVGANRRHCEDSTCASERRPTLLGNQCMGLGFRRVCEYLESNYWILRAHRATHPSVSDVVARTRGGGFSEVLSTDRRVFRRGEGWDGAGTGPMEMEMP
ncbi:unnamed protein product [Penicillium glandicola]